MLSDSEVQELLDADESEILERKLSLADTDKIQRSIIASANDIANRSGGKIIIGQDDKKKIWIEGFPR